jgi:hypothetical protein
LPKPKHTPTYSGSGIPEVSERKIQQFAQDAHAELCAPAMPFIGAPRFFVPGVPEGPSLMRRPVNAKSDGLSLCGHFGLKDEACDHLGEMAQHKSMLAVIIDAAKKKAVRFDINDFSDSEVKRLDHDVTIFTGNLAKFMDRLFKRVISRPGRQKRS